MIESNVATQIFASIWGLSIVGALRSAREWRLPFDRTWRAHVGSSEREIDLVREHLISIGGFTPAVAKMLVDDAPWRSTRGYLTDTEMIAGELAMMCRAAAVPDIAVMSESSRSQLVASAARHQLAQLVDGMFAASFQSAQSPVPFRAMRKILDAAATIGGEAQPEAARRGAVDEWRRTFLPSLQQAEGFELWARTAMRLVLDSVDDDQLL